MRRQLRWTGLVLVLVLAGAGQAADKNGGKTDKASDQDYTALAQLKEITGKLAKVDATDKSITLEIDMGQVQPKAAQNLARTETHVTHEEERILREQQEALRMTNPV